jgi:hypothetical protein
LAAGDLRPNGGVTTRAVTQCGPARLLSKQVGNARARPCRRRSAHVGCRRLREGDGAWGTPRDRGELPALARAWARTTHDRLPTRQRASANRTDPAIAGSFIGQDS